MVSKDAARKRAQRRMPVLKRCSRCGGKERLQRHHPDIEREPDRFEVLCQRCHTAEDIILGRWRSVPLAMCIICKTQFKPSRARRAKLCGAPACLKECGRRASERRWTMPIAPTACEPAATASSRPKPPTPGEGSGRNSSEAA